MFESIGAGLRVARAGEGAGAVAGAGAGTPLLTGGGFNSAQTCIQDTNEA
jgi:hypothetical protein